MDYGQCLVVRLRSVAVSECAFLVGKKKTCQEGEGWRGSFVLKLEIGCFLLTYAYQIVEYTVCPKVGLPGICCLIIDAFFINGHRKYLFLDSE